MAEDKSRAHDSKPEAATGRAARRPYAAPELLDYGSLTELTKTGGNVVFDFAEGSGGGGFRRPVPQRPSPP